MDEEALMEMAKHVGDLGESIKEVEKLLERVGDSLRKFIRAYAKGKGLSGEDVTRMEAKLAVDFTEKVAVSKDTLRSGMRTMLDLLAEEIGESNR